MSPSAPSELHKRHAYLVIPERTVEASVNDTRIGEEAPHVIGGVDRVDALGDHESPRTQERVHRGVHARGIEESHRDRRTHDSGLGAPTEEPGHRPPVDPFAEIELLHRRADGHCCIGRQAAA